LEAVYHEEGRLVPNGTAWHYEYTLKDHLGNSRVMFRANGSAAQLLQENHYYPFGMEMEGAWTTQVGTENKYQYNGKELVEDFGWNWYPYGARYYDAAVGRFWGVDPIADQFAHASVYNYAENGPINAIDLHGLQRYLVINGYVNQQLSQTTISTVKGANGQLLNLQANNGQGGTVPSDILEINQGDLPNGVNPSVRRDNLTNDENQIINAGVDATQSLIGNGRQGLSSVDGFSLPGSYPARGEIYTGELFVGNYADVQTPVMGNIPVPIRQNIAANFGFTTIGDPNTPNSNYQVTGISDMDGRGTNAILNSVRNGVNNIRANGGTVTNINVRVARGTSLNAASATAITNYANSNLLPSISSRTGVANVNFTFNGNVNNNVIRINGTQNQIGQVGLQVSRVLIP